MAATITVFYSCKGCGLVERPVVVPEREPGQDVVAWMDRTRQIVANDHYATSLQCHRHECDLKIPTTGRGGVVGGPVVQ